MLTHLAPKLAFLTVLVILPILVSSKTFAMPAHFESTIHAPHTIQILETNYQALSHRLDLIQNARQSIQIEIFYFNPDESGQKILAALLQKKSESPEIEIQILMDAWGSKSFPDSYLHLLRTHKIEVRKYLGPRFLGFGPRRKNHRKSWIIDEKIALVGGYNMGDEHFGFSPVFNMIDRDLLIEGPIAKTISKTFEILWKTTDPMPLATAEKLQEPLPKLAPIRPMPLQPSASIQVQQMRYLTDLDREKESSPWLKNQLDQVFRSAKTKITIETKFFFPAWSTFSVLSEKIRANLPVQIFANSSRASEPIDRELILLGLAPLKILRWMGAEVGYFLGGLPGPNQALTEKSLSSLWGTHSKTFLIDETVVVGSFNLDLISAYLNLEHVVIIDSAPLTEAIRQSIIGHTETAASLAN